MDLDFVKRLREQRSDIWNQAKAILDNAAAAKRDLTPAEQTRFDKDNEDMDAIDERVKSLEEAEQRQADVDATFAKILARPDLRGASTAGSALSLEFRRNAQANSREPIIVPLEGHRSFYQPGIERRDILTSTGSGLRGTSFYSQLVEGMVDSSAILRAGATVVQTATGEPLLIPKSTATSTAAIVAEGQPIGESDPTLGTASLGAFKYAFLVQISRELLEDENFGLENYLARQSGIALGNALGAHAIAGTGTTMPVGILSDISAGVTGPTGTSTSFGTQTTAGQGLDLFISLFYSVIAGYRDAPGAAWLMSDATAAMARKLKGTDGKYAWVDSVAGGAPTLLGKPVFTDTNIPDPGVSTESVLFGDCSKVFVRLAGPLRFERSDDFAFSSDLVTYRAIQRADSVLVDTSGAIKSFVHSAT